MTRIRRHVGGGVLVAMLMTGTVSAETKPLSITVAAFGVLTALVGVVLMGTNGEEYRILGRTYCSTNDGHDVKAGACQPVVSTKTANTVAGVGAAMTVIGLIPRRVTISPMVGRDVKGATTTIRWGGR